MKLAWLFFGLLLTICLLVLALFVVGEVPGGHGLPHEKYHDAMQRALPGAQSHTGPIVSLGAALGVVSVLLFVVMLAWGLQTSPDARRQSWMLAVLAALYAASMVALALAYRQYIYGESATVLGFPLSTAVLLFVIWPLPLLFVALYIVRFDRWVVSPRQMEQFQQLVDARRRRGEKAD